MLSKPGVSPELTARQSLACCLRILAKEGWNENFAGHITWQLPDSQTMLCNPDSMWWQEVTAADISEVDFDGNVISGKWGVTEAVFLHTELHRNRLDASVVVHGHPYYATVLSAIPALPYIHHQGSCVFDGELALVNEYRGSIGNASEGQWLANTVGDASGVIMASHGALVTGADLATAAFRAINFERTCRATLDLMKINKRPQDIPEQHRRFVYNWLLEKGKQYYWDGAVRQLIRSEPEVLDQ